MKIRGSIYDHFAISTLARGATRNSFFRKEFRTCRSWFSKHVWKLMKMGLNRSAVSPHGLIFDEDGAKSRPMPLDALPTPRGVVLRPFWSILGRKGVDKICQKIFRIYPFKGPPCLGSTAGVTLAREPGLGAPGNGRILGQPGRPIPGTSH